MIQNKETYQYNALFEEYHPFGTTSYRSGRTETEVSLKRYKYVGKERDEETGLYYYGARYYSAWLCRFVSVDPLASERQWLNPYNHVQNNPINKIDPDGALDDHPPKGANPDLYEEDSGVIQNNNGSKLKENPFWEESGKESISRGIKLSGTERDKKIFIRQLCKVTGNKYGINADGFMYNKSETTNTKTTNKISGELSELVKSAMEDSETFEYDLVRNDPNTLIDSYDTGKVDVGDFAKMDRIMKAGQFTHFISERMENPDNYSQENRTDDNFRVAHEKALISESEVVNAMLNQPNVLVTQNTERVQIQDTDGYSKFYYNATSTYGNVTFGFKQGADVQQLQNNRVKIKPSSLMLSKYKRKN